ncbi:MAG: glycine cleavage T C-terminal barrel domain-containing protein, partial [Pseudomonadota bacterium]
GEPHGVVAYGLEALSIMRLEKGHPIVSELDGRMTAREAGMGKMVSQKKDCIGNVLCRREAMADETGLKMMGFRPVDRSEALTAGAHFVRTGKTVTLENDEGYMTSVGYSPTLGHPIGLGFIKRGGERIGETVRAVDPVRGKDIEVEIVSPHFYDPEGARLRD